MTEGSFSRLSSVLCWKALNNTTLHISVPLCEIHNLSEQPFICGVSTPKLSQEAAQVMPPDIICECPIPAWYRNTSRSRMIPEKGWWGVGHVTTRYTWPKALHKSFWSLPSKSPVGKNPQQLLQICSMRLGQFPFLMVIAFLFSSGYNHL